MKIRTWREPRFPLTKIVAGRYRVQEGKLRFDINKLQTGWRLVGYGNAAHEILTLRGVQGYFVSLKSAHSRLTVILEHPAMQLLQRVLRVPGRGKAEFDITDCDPQDVQDVAGILRRCNYSTYISSGKLSVQR